MNAVLREYILKGVFLGLWTYLALLQPDWATVLRVTGYALAGLGIGFLTGAVIQFLRGYRPWRNLPGFLLITLLDSSFTIYFGLVLGVGLGIFLETDPSTVTSDTFASILGTAALPKVSLGNNWLGYCTIAGAVLGYGLYQLRQIEDWFYRFLLAFVVGAILVYLGITYLEQLPAFATLGAQSAFAKILLLGVPLFYILIFCGEADESEVEIASLCAFLGIGLFLLRLESKLPEYGDKLIFLVPMILYFVYATKVLPGLRVFKHTLRGYGNLSLGRSRDALVHFGRALHLDRRNDLAAKGLFQVHRRIDVSRLDAETAQLLNFGFCLDMAQGLVISDRAPTESEITEATKLLDLVERQDPKQTARVDYLRGVTLTHAKQFDEAAAVLAQLLSPETPYESRIRNAVLLPAWQLVTRFHPELIKRLGTTELAKPGRRIEAIAAVERQLAKEPQDPLAIEMQRELYSTLTEAEYLGSASNTPPTEFNYDYVEQLGLALLQESSLELVERGMAYLRIAGRGLAGRGPQIFKQLADQANKLNRPDEANGYLGQVKRSALLVGPNNLPQEQRDIYFAALNELVEAAVKREDYSSAVDDMRLVVEAGNENVNTLRKLAELYAKNRDPLNALLITERGLLYSKTDPDLLEKKRSYYYSVEPERVQSVKDRITSWFDVPFCVKIAQQVAGQKDADVETLDYGLHMAKLARIIQPEANSTRLAEARLLLRKGERDAGLSLLEDLRAAPRGSGDEEEAWFIATRLLGDLYLDELARPDLAAQCFTDYREYQKSGADTIYRLGQAKEASGDLAGAMKAYELVTAYQNHPRYWDATEAVRRLKGTL
jgi:tetratricopeptide (TPR) repeat protein